MTSVLLIWPMCYTIHLMLEVNFSISLVRDNAALLALLAPVITMAVSLLWNATWKPTLFDHTERFLDRCCVCVQTRESAEAV